MFNMFCRCEKELEFEHITKKLEGLRSQNVVIHENIDRLIREISQLKTQVISQEQSQPKKTRGKK